MDLRHGHRPVVRSAAWVVWAEEALALPRGLT